MRTQNMNKLATGLSIAALCLGGLAGFGASSMGVGKFKADTETRLNKNDQDHAKLDCVREDLRELKTDIQWIKRELERKSESSLQVPPEATPKTSTSSSSARPAQG